MDNFIKVNYFACFKYHNNSKIEINTQRTMFPVFILKNESSFEA